MPSVTTQWRVLQGRQSSGCVVGCRPAGMVEPTPLGVSPESGLKVQLKLKASTTRRAFRSASVILDNYTTRGGEAPSRSSTGWRFWKYLRIMKQAAAAARCLRVCPLNKYPAE